jgi:hypothetical protein
MATGTFRTMRPNGARRIAAPSVDVTARVGWAVCPWLSPRMIIEIPRQSTSSCSYAIDRVRPSASDTSFRQRAWSPAFQPGRIQRGVAIDKREGAFEMRLPRRVPHGAASHVEIILSNQLACLKAAVLTASIVGKIYRLGILGNVRSSDSEGRVSGVRSPRVAGPRLREETRTSSSSTDPRRTIRAAGPHKELVQRKPTSSYRRRTLLLPRRHAYDPM